MFLICFTLTTLQITRNTEKYSFLLIVTSAIEFSRVNIDIYWFPFLLMFEKRPLSIF